LVTVEEGFPQSSVGTEIATRVQQQAFDYLDAPVITDCGQGRSDALCRKPGKAGLAQCGEVIDAVKAVTYKA
jgi:pyruvate dehydrogenase E1 component beta subunit